MTIRIPAPLVAAATLCCALSACDDPTPPAPDAGPAIPDAGPIAEPLQMTIDGVELADGRLVVDLTVRGADDRPLDGLATGDIHLTFARLEALGDDDAAGWTSYINRVDPSAEGGAIQPTAERDGAVAALGEGRYTYTSTLDVTRITAPAAVGWRPAVLHRVGLQLAPGRPPANATHDFVPAGGAPPATRRLVSNAACDACHGRLTHHEGARLDVDLCVTCHTAGTHDPQTGRALDFEVLIHKLHLGHRLPSVRDGIPYVIVGDDGIERDYSDVRLPMDIRNCTTCHDPDDPATPDAHRWRSTVNRAVCGACHDDIDFDRGEEGGHPGGPQPDDTRCGDCHVDGGEAGGVADTHARPERVWAERYTYELLAIDGTAPGERARITYRITDPDGRPYDLAAHPSFTSASTRLRLDVSWSTTEHGPANTGPPPASPLEVDPLTGTALGDGRYVIELPEPVPEDAGGTGAVVFEGHVAGDFDGDGRFGNTVPVRSAIAYFAITDEAPAPRRVVVDERRCLGCHGPHDGLARHGGNRVDDIRICVTCHNPDNTDLAQRPTDPDATHDGANAAARDGLEQRPIDFKVLVHAIHAAEMRTEPFLVYGYVNLPHDFSEVRFPGALARCESCHLPGTYTLPFDGPRRATTVDAGATVLRSDLLGRPMFDDADAASDPSDDIVTTAVAAACGACHDDGATAEHMRQNGAGVRVPAREVDAGAFAERCDACHGVGQPFAVEAVHRP